MVGFGLGSYERIWVVVGSRVFWGPFFLIRHIEEKEIDGISNIFLK